MPLPLIPALIALGSSALAALGIKKGKDGIDQMRQAKKIVADAQTRYEQSVNQAEAEKRALNQAVEAYLELQVSVLRGACRRFINFVEAIGQKGHVKDLEALEAVGLDIDSLGQLRVQVVEAEGLVWGGVGAAAAGVATAGATTTLVGLLGTASTGAAIGGLSGAAANSAILAWLGGGSLATGGGGMAMGSVVLGGVVAGPGLAVAGWALAAQGEKALTGAQNQVSQAEKKRAEVVRLGKFLRRVKTRVGELTTVVGELDGRACAVLDDLEAVDPFNIDSEQHVGSFQRAAILVRGLSQIIHAPIIDDDGGLNEDTARLVQTLRRVALEDAT